MEKETKISITITGDRNHFKTTSDKTDIKITGVAALHFVQEFVNSYAEFHENSNAHLAGLSISNESAALILMASLVNFKTLILEKIDTLGIIMMRSLSVETAKIISETLKMENRGISKNKMRKQIDKLVPSETNEYKEQLLRLWADKHALASFEPIIKPTTH
jgi:hypothetical protein